MRDALEVNQIFDKISYLKGCSVIRMLASHLGIKTFLKGIALYLKKHAYANATTEDLWSALSEATGQDVNVRSNHRGTYGLGDANKQAEAHELLDREDRFPSGYRE